MNTTLAIQNLIDQAKKAPNGLLRNKLVSKLEDAKIVSELIDLKYGAPVDYRPTPSGTAGPGGNMQMPINGPFDSECICVVGARNRSCPAVIHV